ncbi:MAG: hypothetical protein H8E27_10735 [Verrucomicrobia subdivision 3 bacterium]|nr:hypothetical protein [Limisphaerales bacterium]
MKIKLYFLAGVFLVAVWGCGKQGTLTRLSNDDMAIWAAMNRVAIVYDHNYLKNGKPLPNTFEYLGLRPDGIFRGKKPVFVSYKYFYYSPKGDMKNAKGDPIYMAVRLPDLEKEEVNLVYTFSFEKFNDKKTGGVIIGQAKMSAGWIKKYKKFQVWPNIKPPVKFGVKKNNK